MKPKKEIAMINPEITSPIDLPSGITLYPSHDEAIERILNELLERCPAEFILLAEISGQILSALGERTTIDLAALGSLVAGDLAASQEIARLTAQYENYQLILREGPKSNTFIAESGTHLALFVRVSKEIPLGWARLLIHETSRQLSEIITTRPEDLKKLDLGLSEEKLSSLVNDDLDSIWKG